MRHVHWRCLQSEDAEGEFALNIPDVRGYVCDSGQVFALACTDNYTTIKNKPWDILSWTATVPESLLSGLKNVF